MKKSVIIGNKSNVLLTHICKEKLLFFIFITVLFGITFGSLIFNASDLTLKNEILIYFNIYKNGLNSLKLSELLYINIKNGLPYFFILLFSGSSIFGKYLIVPFTFIKASGLGALISFYYDAFKLQGLGFTLLILIPGKIIYIFALLIMTKYCYEFSSSIISSELNTKSSKEYVYIFLLRCIVYLLMILFSFVIDTICAYAFNSLFDFTS